MQTPIANQSHLHHRQVEIEGISIHLVEGGAIEHPTLLFLHGWPESWAMFEQIMIPLSTEAHVVAIDLPGVGASEMGCFPKPRRVIPPELLYAQVVKHREHGRVVAVSHKVVFGSAEAVQQRLQESAASTAINTSFVERENRTLRAHNQRLARKAGGFSHELGWLERQLWVMLAYYHLVLPHASLRVALSEPQPTCGNGTARRWRPTSPAMAAGVTDHIWTTSELLSYRVPVTFLEQLNELEHLFPAFGSTHHGY